MADDAELNELRDDLRITIRALDHEVQKLVATIERAERIVRGATTSTRDAVTALTTPAARPTKLADLREDGPAGS